MHEKSAFYIIDLQRKICQQIKKQKQQECAQLKFVGEKKDLATLHITMLKANKFGLCVLIYFFV